MEVVTLTFTIVGLCVLPERIFCCRVSDFCSINISYAADGELATFSLQHGLELVWNYYRDHCGGKEDGIQKVGLDPMEVGTRAEGQGDAGEYSMLPPLVRTRPTLVH